MTRDDFQIRSLHPSDLRRVVEIECRSYTAPWSREVFQREYRSAGSLYVAGEMEGVVVGYAGFWIVEDEAHLTTIAVDPLVRGRNLSDRLLCHLIEAGRRQGVRRMTLEVRSRNTVARSLYTKYGFAEIAIRKRYYTQPIDDAIIMWVENVDQAEYTSFLETLARQWKPVGRLPDSLRESVACATSGALSR